LQKKLLELVTGWHTGGSK
jgi:hypothetical protein